MAAGLQSAWWRALLGAALTGVCVSASPPPPSLSAPPTDPGPPLPADLSRFDPQVRRQLEHLAAAVESDPADASRWRQLGVACQAYGEHAIAGRCYERCVRLGGHDARDWYLLAIVRERLGATEPAIDSLRRSIGLHERSASHRLLARWLMRLGRLVEAESEASRAHELDPRDPHCRLLLARIALQGRDHRQAADHIDGVLDHDPDNGYAHFLLGTALRGLGRLEEAGSHLVRGQAEEPDWPDDWLEPVRAASRGDHATIRLALAALRRADARAAVALLEPLQERRVDDIDLVVNLARAYRMQGRTDAAIAVLDDARDRRGDHHLLSFHLAAACRQKAAVPGMPDDESAEFRAAALRHADRTIELSPTFAAGHAIRGDVLLDLDRPEPALDAYVAACERGPGEPRWFIQLGKGLCRQERWADAVVPLRRARDLDDTDPAIVHLLAAALANSGQLDDARQLLESALRRSPSDGRLRRALERVRSAQTAAVGASS